MAAYKPRLRIFIVFLLLTACFHVVRRVHAQPAEYGLAHPPVALSLGSVEPTILNNQQSQQLSLYGTDFSEACIVRLLGYGLLNTTYMNQSTLTAQVPAGVMPGTYDIEITDGEQSSLLAKAVTIIAPTPTPKPTPIPSTPPPGRPILTIRNYSITPQIVDAGEEFTVSLELYNNGSRAGENTMVVFPGNEFIPVGDAGHLLWQLHINHTVVVTQKLRAPASMSSGMHHIQVHTGANDWEGNHYDYPHTIPVEVRGKAPVTGQPRITIEGVTTQPEVLIPGAPFTLTMQLANRGSRTALNVFARYQADHIYPQTGSDTVSVPVIGIEDTVAITVPLMLSPSAQGGWQKLDMLLEFEDYSGMRYTSQEIVGITVDAGLELRPKLLIHTTTTDPALITPGAAFTLSVTVENVGGGMAEHLSLALGGDNGAALAPLSILHAGNVGYVASLDGHDQIEVTWQAITDGNAQAKAYNIPLALSYDDAYGERHSDIQSVSLLIHHIPELEAMFYRDPGTLTVGVPSDVSLEVFNVGQGAINIQKLDVAGTSMSVQIEGANFTGSVEPGGSAPLDITITPAEAGSKTLDILTTYRDTYNTQHVITLTLQLDVTGNQDPNAGGENRGGEPVSNSEESNTNGWQLLTRFLKGFFGFGS